MFKPGDPMEQLFEGAYRVPSVSNLCSYHVDENGSINDEGGEPQGHSWGIIELLDTLGKLKVLMAL